MDSERFDTITRTLAPGMSRRGVLRTLTGAAVGGLLVAVGVGEAGAKKARRVQAQKGPCKKPYRRCPKGKDAICTNTQTDSDNCGGCGTVCTGGKTCVSGQCSTPACVADCTGKCGGATDGCTGTCDAACPATCSPACSYPQQCYTSVDGANFCSNWYYCRNCTSDAGCAVAGSSTVYYCVDLGFDQCGVGYTTVCMWP